MTEQVAQHQPLPEDDRFTFVKVNEQASEVIDAPRYSYWHAVSRTFFSKKIAVVMMVIAIIVISMAIFQPMVSGFVFDRHPNVNNFATHYLWPSSSNLFGTDKYGDSLFDVVWSGARTSVSIGFLATLITTVVGVLVGAVWGYSKKIDRFMLEVYNVISNVPMLLIIMVLSYALGNGFWNLLFSMTVTSWVGTAYFIRVQVMIIRDRDYNLASRCLGTPMHRVITRNILPYLISVIVTDVSRALPSFISYEVFLSYLGVGLGQHVASLGRTISENAQNMSTYFYLFWIPVAILAIITVSLYIVGQTLADASDPRTHY